MKKKLMIALVILALVFGMVLIACDDGDLPEIKTKIDEVIIDKGFVTYIDEDLAGHKTFKNGINGDTTNDKAPEDWDEDDDGEYSYSWLEGLEDYIKSFLEP